MKNDEVPNDAPAKIINGLPDKRGLGKESSGATDAQDRSVLNVEQNLSNFATSQIPPEVEFNTSSLIFSLICLILSMLLLSFASSPIYELFCKATGFGGTIKQGQVRHFTENSNRKISIEFDANVSPDLQWQFIPKQRRIDIQPGQNILIFYEATNTSHQDIIGTSVYNITPLKAGQYFVKVHCFCYEEQYLKAGEKVLMPVSFYIDPDFAKDPEMEDVTTITLSYSFFKVRALEAIK